MTNEQFNKLIERIDMLIDKTENVAGTIRAAMFRIGGRGAGTFDIGEAVAYLGGDMDIFNSVVKHVDGGRITAADLEHAAFVLLPEEIERGLDDHVH